MVTLEKGKTDGRTICPALRRDGTPCKSYGLGGEHNGFCIGHSPVRNGYTSQKTAVEVAHTKMDIPDYGDTPNETLPPAIIETTPVLASSPPAGEITLLGQLADLVDQLRQLIVEMRRPPEIDASNKAMGYIEGRQAAFSQLHAISRGPLHVGCACPEFDVMLDVVKNWEKTVKDAEKRPPTACPNGSCPTCLNRGINRKLKSIVLCPMHRGESNAGSVCKCKAYCSECASVAYSLEDKQR